MQARGPRKKLNITFTRFTALKLSQCRQGRTLNPLNLITFNLIAPAKLGDGGIAHVMVMKPPEQIVEHAQAQSTIGISHALDAQLLKNRRHDRNTARHHRQTITVNPR